MPLTSGRSGHSPLSAAAGLPRTGWRPAPHGVPLTCPTRGCPFSPPPGALTSPASARLLPAVTAPRSPQNVDQHLFTLPQGYGQFAFGIFDDSFEIPTLPPGAQTDDGRDPEGRREREPHSRHRYGARQPRARLTARRATGRHEGVPTLEG